ncbi:MAG: LPS export ABC transporter permease LptG [Amphritea sp.]|nr:LPS export ABC transporter permease LptG [Amphritea sp.]
MRKLDIYIGKQVLLSILIVLLIVIGLDFMFRVLEEMPEVNERYTVTRMLIYSSYQVPAAVYEYLPLSCLIGCLVGLGGLASGSELTVMRAAGVSVARLVTTVLKPVIALSLLAMLLGEYVAPYAGTVAESRRAELLSRGTVSGKTGIWHREKDEYVHINVVTPTGEIRGITRFVLNPDSSLALTSIAQSGVHQGDHWQLSNVVETRFHGDSTEISEHATQSWDLKLTPQRLKVLLVKPKEMSTSELYRYSQYLAEQELDNDRFMQTFWRKMLQPLAIIGLVLVAVSFIFGSLRSVSTGQRIVAGVVVGMIFKISQDILAPFSSIVHIEPIWAALIPIGICMLLGTWMLRRVG